MRIPRGTQLPITTQQHTAQEATQEAFNTVKPESLSNGRAEITSTRFNQPIPYDIDVENMIPSRVD